MPFNDDVVSLCLQVVQAIPQHERLSREALQQARPCFNNLGSPAMSGQSSLPLAPTSGITPGMEACDHERDVARDAEVHGIRKAPDEGSARIAKHDRKPVGLSPIACKVA